jgi:nitrate reductase gamma subunit
MLLDLALFCALGLIALAVMVVGIIYRIITWVSPGGLTSLASVSVISYHWGVVSRAIEVVRRIITFYTLMYASRSLFWGAFLFHWGIFLTLFLGHTALFFTPEQLEAMGVPYELRKELAVYMGAAFSLIMLAGLAILWARRLGRRDVRAISYLDDWFALTLITIIVVIGTINTTVIHPDYVHTVTPWLVNLLSGNIMEAARYISEAHVMVKVHVLLAEILMLYVPFGKMVHPFAIFFEPTITMAPYKITGSREAGLRS